MTDVYAAGEKRIRSLSKERFVNEINKNKKNFAKTLDNFNHLPKIILNEAERGDIVIFIGAGDISKWVNDLPDKWDYSLNIYYKTKYFKKALINKKKSFILIFQKI